MFETQYLWSLALHAHSLIPHLKYHILYKSFLHYLILDISLASETFVAHIVLLWNFSYYTLCWIKFPYLISLPHCSSKKDKLHVLPILIISITLAQWQYVRGVPISAEYGPVDQRSGNSKLGIKCVYLCILRGNCKWIAAKLYHWQNSWTKQIRYVHLSNLLLLTFRKFCQSTEVWSITMFIISQNHGQSKSKRKHNIIRKALFKKWVGT